MHCYKGQVVHIMLNRRRKLRTLTLINASIENTNIHKYYI